MKNMKKKSLLMLATMVLLLTFAVGSTIAYLATHTTPVTNTFTPTEITTTVTENFDGNVKESVKIKNTGNTDAYIRAAVVVTWQNTDGEGEVLATKPVEGTDYQITWKRDGWTGLESDGFYYYSSKVAPDGSTGVLFTDCKPLKAAPEEGYTLHVEIIGQGIQAEGMGATSAQAAFAKAAQK